MHKLTAALLSAFVAVKRTAANVSARIHAFLINLHIANLRALVARAEARVKRLIDVERYHKAAYIEAGKVADEAHADAQAVAAKVETEVAALGK